MVSILIPTKGRPEKLERCIRSIDVYCEILVLATAESDITPFIDQDSRVQVFFDFDKKLSVVACQNELADRARFNLLPLSDDIEFDKGSIQKAIDAIDEKFDGDGVVAFHVRNMQCNDDAFLLVGKKFYEETLKRELFHSGYKHFYADTELGKIAKHAKKFFHCNEATMINYHPNAGFQEDATHQDRRGEKIIHDEELYRRRVLHGQIPA